MLAIFAAYPIQVFGLFALFKIDALDLKTFPIAQHPTLQSFVNHFPSSAFEIFLAGLILFYVVEQVLRLRKHLAFANGLPPQLVGRVSDAKYAESTAHNKFKNGFGAVKDFYSLVSTILSIFVFWPVTWSLTQYYFKEYEYAQTLIVPAVFSALSEVIDLCLMGPVNAYGTFIVDEKHNNYTIAGYVKDKVKWLLIGVVLNGLFMFGLISIVDWAGPDAWKYMIGFVTCVVMSIQILFPVTVAKLFNTFTPLPEGDLKIAIDELVSKTKLDCNQCYMVDGSAQSKHSNAYVAGMCGTRRIVIYDTLVKDLKNDKARINAVVGHEIGHAKLYHNWILTTLMTLNFSSMFYIFSFFQSNADMVASFGFPTTGVNVDKENAVTTFLILHCFMAVYSSCIMPFWSVLLNSIVRQLEFAADRYSVSLGYDIRLALLDLGLENLSDMNPDPWHAAWHYSHPPLVSRLNAVTKLLNNAPMPDDKVIQYIQMPSTKTKTDGEAETTGTPVTAGTANSSVKEQSSLHMEAEAFNVENSSSDDDGENDASPTIGAAAALPAVVMAPPSDAPPPTGVAALIGTRNMAAEGNSNIDNKPFVMVAHCTLPKEHPDTPDRHLNRRLSQDDMPASRHASQSEISM